MSNDAAVVPLDREIERASNVAERLHGHLHGLRIPALSTEKRVQLSCAALHVAIEHHQAIIELIRAQLFGSALALLRPCIEAAFRGFWLLRNATDDQLDAVGRDDRGAFPGFVDIVRDVERVIDGEEEGFSSLLRDRWAWACSYTHTGYQQIGARLTSDGLGSAYTDEELRSALIVSGVMATLAASYLAATVPNEALALEIAELLKR